MAVNTAITEYTFTGENQFSDEIIVGENGMSDVMQLAIIGTYSAKINLQFQVLKLDGTYTEWTDTGDTYNSVEGQFNHLVLTKAKYRVGIKTGNYTSGSPFIQLKYTRG